MSLLRTIGTRVPAVASIEQAIANPSKRSYETLRAVRPHEEKRRQRGAGGGDYTATRRMNDAEGEIGRDARAP